MTPTVQGIATTQPSASTHENAACSRHTCGWCGCDTQWQPAPVRPGCSIDRLAPTPTTIGRSASPARSRGWLAHLLGNRRPSDAQANVATWVPTKNAATTNPRTTTWLIASAFARR